MVGFSSHARFLRTGTAENRGISGFSRQGVGTLLLQAAFVEGLRRGCLRCFLEVRKSNEGAMRFYFGHEFRIAGERTNYYTNPLEDAWIMERYL